MEALKAMHQHLFGFGNRCCPKADANNRAKIYAFALTLLQWTPGVVILSCLTPRATYIAAISEGIAHFTVWPAIAARKKMSFEHRRAHEIHEALMFSFIIIAIKHVRTGKWSMVIPLDLVLAAQMKYSSQRLLGDYTGQPNQTF